MKIIPIASDSLGVRSMATYIETKDCKILIDPSVALGSKRYGLPPHEKEKKAYDNSIKKIYDYSKICDILTISHYHYDHYTQNTATYKNKKVFAKDISNKINKSQKKRGEELQNNIEKICNLNYCDDTEYKIGKTKITFSPAFYHGPEKIRLGYVIMTMIKDERYKILHTSDVQGPVSDRARDYIIDQKPDLLILDGPPTILLGYRFSKKNLQKASDNLVKIPKFKFETEYNLNQALKNIGINDAFNPGVADFSKMDGTKNLYISEALHKAYIEVNEEGTEAAAATAIVMTLSMVPNQFMADHPFLFLIEHKETGAILFMGRVMNPAE